MYTRSYGNQRNGMRSSLPPDYGGTALVIHQPEPPTPRSVPDPEPDKSLSPNWQGNRTVTGERHARRPQQNRPSPVTEDNGTSARRLLQKDDRPRRGIGSVGRSPFGGKAGAFAEPEKGREYAGDRENRNSEDFEEPLSSPFSAFLDPAQLKSDDLLLLGLIFLLLSDSAKSENGGENCREALLILAVLYLSGL